MIVKRYSIRNQQKITVGILNKGFYTTFKWFHKFDSKKDTIVKIELSSIDIEKVFTKSLFYKNGLTDCEYTEMQLQDIIAYDAFIPYNVSDMMLKHPILLKRNLTYDDLHICIYCFKGTLKAINLLLKYNKLPWSSKANRTAEENRIIYMMKFRKTPGFSEIRNALINDLDYEIIDRIYDVEIMEDLLEDEEIPFHDLIAKRLIEFTESQDMDSRTYIEDY